MGRRAALVYFAKAPVAGGVKTRLCPPLTEAEAAGLYQGFLADTLRAVAGAEALVYGWPETELEKISAVMPEALELRAQRGDDLWQRIIACQGELLAEGYDCVLIRNTDSPDLPQERIAEAIAACAPGRVVLGPDHGGGYYLIGVCELHPALFADLAEGTDSVLAATIAKAGELGLEVVQLPVHSDVDRYEDLLNLWKRRGR